MGFSCYDLVYGRGTEGKEKVKKKTVCLSPVYHSQGHCNNRLLPFEVKTLGLKENVIRDYDFPRFLQ